MDSFIAPHWLLFVFLLAVVRWSPSVVLVCISVVDSEVEHFPHMLTGYLLIIFRNYWLMPFVHLLTEQFDFLLFSFLFFFHSLDINILSCK